MATSASTLDLARTASVADREAAKSAASLDLLRADSTAMVLEYLDRRWSTDSMSRGSKESRGKTS